MLMEILNHSRISTTVDVYTRVIHVTQDPGSHMARLPKRRLDRV
ncbi:hypothetical protein [Streptomyces kronopolitis]|nr:hypothetical protein [Streptomyces kronopolitis]